MLLEGQKPFSQHFVLTLNIHTRGTLEESTDTNFPTDNSQHVWWHCSHKTSCLLSEGNNAPLLPADTRSIALSYCYHYLFCTLLPHKLNATSSLLFSGGCSDALWGIYGKAKVEVDEVTGVRAGMPKMYFAQNNPQKAFTSQMVSLSNVSDFP